MLRFLPLAMILTASQIFAGTPATNPFSETVTQQKLPSGVRIVTNAPAKLDPNRRPFLILYALPNGNTIEQTVGCAEAPGIDWHYYIQHIGAQMRRLREIMPQQDIVVAYLEADGKAWPGWRAAHPDNPAQIRKMIDDLAKKYNNPRIALAAHSGGGSFITGFLNSADKIDPRVERIAYLDANYSYDDEKDHHGDKLIAWLKGDKNRHLEVICYDDRNITLNGKLVVTPTGGTFRATHRMMDRFGKESPDFLKTFDNRNTIEKYLACNGQAEILIHRNPDNKILHTVLVGDMSGFLQAMTMGTVDEKKWGTFAGPVSYKQWIQPAPNSGATTKPATTKPATTQSATTLATTAPASDQSPPALDVSIAFPPRAANAVGGHDVMKHVDKLPPKEREAQLVTEILAGNVPDFMRQGVAIPAEIKGHKIVYVVSPDYLALGSNEDFVRIPLTPGSAQKIADAMNCSLPTRKIVNDIYARAVVKIEPQPLTDARESAATFTAHNDLIETKRSKGQAGELTAGHKKDVVITNRLLEKPNRVAIFGWHKLNNQPIQPLTTIHGNFYVDYSHGIRLVKEDVLVDGKPLKLEDVLRDEGLSPLVSDEGPLKITKY